MYISGSSMTPFTLLRFTFRPKTTRALQWVNTSNGNWKSIDRTAATDIYQSELFIYGTEGEINQIIYEIEQNRIADSNYFTLSQFNGIEDQVFGADIDYSGSLNVTTISWEKKSQKNFKVFTLAIVIQLVTSPYPYTGTPSLPTLKPEIGYSGDSLYSIEKIDSYENAFTYLDHSADSGFLKFSCKLSHSDMNAFRRYLMTTIRGTEMTIASLPGVDYPFGTNRGTYPIKVKVIDFSDMLLDVNYWKISLTLAESFD